MPDAIIIGMTALIIYSIIGAVLIMFEVTNAVNNGSTWRNAIYTIHEDCKKEFFGDNPELNKLGLFVRNLYRIILFIPPVILSIILIIVYIVFSTIGRFLFYKKEKK